MSAIQEPGKFTWHDGDLSDWTPCQVHGHAFDPETGRCDCGETRED